MPNSLGLNCDYATIKYVSIAPHSRTDRATVVLNAYANTDPTPGTGRFTPTRRGVANFGTTADADAASIFGVASAQPVKSLGRTVMHIYEVRRRKDHWNVDLNSDTGALSHWASIVRGFSPLA